jgi:hypothetical protein
MTEDAMTPGRDQHHAEVIGRLMGVAQRPAGYKAAEVRTIAREAADWANTLLCDLKGHEKAAIAAAPTERDMAAFGAAEASGFYAPCEDQAPLRQAFEDGAAFAHTGKLPPPESLPQTYQPTAPDAGVTRKDIYGDLRQHLCLIREVDEDEWELSAASVERAADAILARLAHAQRRG